jgi:hypothetical protein
VHLNNPGYKEKKKKEEERLAESGGTANIVLVDIPDQKFMEPHEFALSVIDSTITAAVNIQNKKNKH